MGEVPLHTTNPNPDPEAGRGGSEAVHLDDFQQILRMSLEARNLARASGSRGEGHLAHGKTPTPLGLP